MAFFKTMQVNEHPILVVDSAFAPGYTRVLSGDSPFTIGLSGACGPFRGSVLENHPVQGS